MKYYYKLFRTVQEEYEIESDVPLSTPEVVARAENPSRVVVLRDRIRKNWNLANASPAPEPSAPEGTKA